MPRFKRTPTEVEALQWLGTNLEEMQAFCGQRLTRDDYHVEVFNPIGTYLLRPLDSYTDFTGELWVAANGTNHAVETGAWVVKGDGGFYVMKGGQFQRTFEAEPTEETLEKVANGLRAANLNDQQITDAISGMQTEGILFRERIREQSP